MGKGRQSGGVKSKAAPARKLSWELGAVETIAWILGLGLVAFRCLVQESFDYGWQLSFGLRDMVSDPQAAVLVSPGSVTTVWLALGMLVTFILWVVAWVNDGCKRPRRTHLTIPLLGLLLAVIVSTLAAANKRPAIVMGTDLLATVLLGWTMVQLLRRRWQVRVTVAILLAVGCVQAIKAFYQAGVELPATRRAYYESRDKFLAAPGVRVDSGSLAEFEKRLDGATGTGTFHHANAFAAMLLLLGGAGIGLATAKFARIRHPFGWLFAVVTALGVLAILAALFATGSLGAMVGLAVAGIVFVLLWLRGRWLVAHLRIVGIAIAGLLVLAAVGVVSYGQSKGTLPTTNLAVRWEYWRGAAGMIGDRGLFGVGAGNFGDHYTQYMSPRGGEEVKDAHGMFVHATAELGWLGGLATVAMFALPMIGAARAAAKRTRNGKLPPVEPLRPSPLNHALWPGLAVLVVMIFILGFGGHWPYGPMPLLVVFVVAPFLITAVCSLASSDTLGPLADEKSPWLRWGIWAAIAGFLVHGQISLALNVPAVRTVVIVLMAAAIALDRIDERGRGESSSSSSSRILPDWAGRGVLVLACGLLMLQVTFLVLPVTDANQFVERAVGEYRGALVLAGQSETMKDSIARQAIERAIEADSLDASPHILLAELNLMRARRLPKTVSAGIYYDAADRAWRRVRRRRPNSAAMVGMHADLLIEYLHRESSILTPDDRLLLRGRLSRRIMALSRRAIQLHPVGREHHIRMAEVFLADGEDEREAALKHFRRALSLDDALPAHHATRKLRKSRRENVERQIKKLSARSATRGI